MRTNARLLFALLFVSVLAAQNIPAPAEFAGHPIGADRRLVRWEKIVEYMNVIAKGSRRVQVRTLGKTTQGNPFIVVIISSPENLARLDYYRDIAARLASGRLSDPEAQRLAGEGKVFVVINHNIHSTEIASSQTTLEMVYRLADRKSVV